MWNHVADAVELRDDSLFDVTLMGLPIIIVKTADQVFALANKCAHMACPMSDGTIDGYQLRCACHDWTYDIRTGEFEAAREIKIQTYDVKIEDGKVLLRMEEPR